MKPLIASLTLLLLVFVSHPLQAVPTTNADTYSIDEDQALNTNASSGVLDNDTAPGDLTAILESGVSNGSLTLNSDGSFTYTPDPNFHGTDSFTYRASESPSGGQEFTVNQAASSASIDASVSAAVPGFGTLSSSDSDNSQLQGTLTAQVTPDSEPFSEIHITDFEISNSDNVTLSFPFRFVFVEVARVEVTADAGGISIEMVTPSPPSAVDASGNLSQLANITRGTGTVNVTASGAAAGQIPEGDQVFDASDVLVDLAGTITQSGNTLTLTAPFNFNGPFDLGGGNGITLDINGTLVATSPVQVPELSAPTTVTIIVDPVNDAPAITDDQFSTAANSTLTVAATPDGVLVNDTDIDGDSLTASVFTPPSNGTLTLAPNGSFTYMPNPGFTGTDSFIYEAQDVNDLLPRALIPFGDDWKFLDDGSDQGIAWRTSAFDDSTWASGPGELGYGEPADDQETELGFGPDEDNKFATTYFRNHFFVGNTADLSDSVQIQLLRDDAAAVYINGIEVYRDSNLASNAAFNTYATSGVLNENAIVSVSVPLAAFVNGRNTIAVEVHQASPTSSDLAFHLALLSVVPAETPIVPLSSVWRYEDTGINLGTTWTTAAFDDALWPSGPGVLGYGEDDETTQLDTPADPKPLTVYFRHSFNLLDASQVQTLAVDLVRDDGIAVYLNGTEIVRDNLADGAAFDTAATSATGGDDETRLRSFVKIDPTLLVDGENIISAEVHQANPTSTDLRFDLQIRAAMTRSLGLTTIDVIGIPFIDTDNDDIDDNWENANGLIVGIDDSALDADGDGQSNLAEFIALTNPQDPTSLLKILAVTQAANAELTVNFSSIPGNSYQLQYSADLSSFSDVTGATLIATTAESSFTTVSPTVTRGYLRVIVQ